VLLIEGTCFISWELEKVTLKLSLYPTGRRGEHQSEDGGPMGLAEEAPEFSFFQMSWYLSVAKTSGVSM
jgi:hypothetical protein